MTTFWSLYITALTVGTLIALWLVSPPARARPRVLPKRPWATHTTASRYDNPLPKWWFMHRHHRLLRRLPGPVPGLKGVLPGYEGGWTQDKQWEREMNIAQEKYAAMPIEEVARTSTP